MGCRRPCRLLGRRRRSTSRPDSASPAAGKTHSTLCRADYAYGMPQQRLGELCVPHYGLEIRPHWRVDSCCRQSLCHRSRQGSCRLLLEGRSACLVGSSRTCAGSLDLELKCGLTYPPCILCERRRGRRGPFSPASIAGVGRRLGIGGCRVRRRLDRPFLGASCAFSRFRCRWAWLV